MDPAFSLADELASSSSSTHHLDYPQQHHAGGGSLDDELDFHSAAYAGGSLDDELHAAAHQGFGSLDAELDGMHIGYAHGNDLASELEAGGGGGGGSLAAELEADLLPHHHHPHEASSLSAEPLSRNHSSTHQENEQLPSTSIAALASAQQAEVEASIAATQAFLSRLASLSYKGEGAEDTERIESLAGRFLKTLAECSVEREAQLRELREVNRKLSLFSDPQQGSFGLPSTNSWQSSLSAVEEHDHTASASTDSILTLTPTANLTTPLVHSTLFTPLYTSTADVVSSLITLHESTQITKSSTADAQRKLKSLKTLLAQWRAENDSVQASEDYIASATHQQGIEIGGRGEWAREQTAWCADRIAQVEQRMRTLLTPISIGSS